MSKETYFVVTSTEGGTTIEAVDEDVLLERITTNDDGYTHYGHGSIQFADHVPTSDSGHWDDPSIPDGAILIIKGSIVVPKPVVVTKKFIL